MLRIWDIKRTSTQTCADYPFVTKWVILGKKNLLLLAQVEQKSVLKCKLRKVTYFKLALSEKRLFANFELNINTTIYLIYNHDY